MLLNSGLVTNAILVVDHRLNLPELALFHAVPTLFAPEVSIPKLFSNHPEELVLRLPFDPREVATIPEQDEAKVSFTTEDNGFRHRPRRLGEGHNRRGSPQRAGRILRPSSRSVPSRRILQHPPHRLVQVITGDSIPLPDVRKNLWVTGIGTGEVSPKPSHAEILVMCGWVAKRLHQKDGFLSLSLIESIQTSIEDSCGILLPYTPLPTRINFSTSVGIGQRR